MQANAQGFMTMKVGPSSSISLGPAVQFTMIVPYLGKRNWLKPKNDLKPGMEEREGLAWSTKTIAT